MASSVAATSYPGLTASGTILGTIQYMAPEVLEGKDADSRTDIFAFGAVLYELFTGRKAFDAKTQAALIHRIMGVDPPVISSLQSLSPPALDQTVQRCLGKAPDDRWQSAADLYRELQWIADTSTTAPPSGWSAAQQARRSASLGWIAAAVLLAVLVTTWVTVRFGASPAAAGLGRLKVAVFYPDPMRTGPAYEDGAIQQSGFQTAYDEFAQGSAAAVTPAWNPYLLPQDNKNVSLRDDLLPRMQKLYRDGYRIFVLTMSVAVQDLRPVFENWRQQLSEPDAPILISTVASAPDIANRKEGILRFYVRSEEEASELARFAAWRQGLRRLGVFYVTESAKRPNAYGYGGFTAVSHVFSRDLQGTIEPHPVLANGRNATAEVSEFVATAQGRDVGAFVIGYDTMLKETLNALISSGFAGPILTTSTLTEPL